MLVPSGREDEVTATQTLLRMQSSEGVSNEVTHLIFTLPGNGMGGSGWLREPLVA
jgi:hypothetical protein